jgi:hypothetical protein
VQESFGIGITCALAIKLSAKKSMSSARRLMSLVKMKIRAGHARCFFVLIAEKNRFGGAIRLANLKKSEKWPCSAFRLISFYFEEMICTDQRL